VRSVRIPAFAKVNLRLEVLARRPDGYHELRTIFQTIGLHDTLELSWRRGPGIELKISWDNPRHAAPLSPGRENLVWRAIDAARRELRVGRGLHARLIKSIPVARGLGGGSSDAAAALVAFQRLADRRIQLPRLLEIAASLGADVPFFLFGGTALGVGRGDEIYPLPNSPRRTILVVSPTDIGVPTSDAYHWVSRKLTKRRQPSKIHSFCALCWSPPGETLANDFEPAVFRRFPRLAAIKRALLQSGAAEAALAGSGSAVFGVFRNPAQARRSAQRFPEDAVFVTDSVSREEVFRFYWH